MKFLKWFFGIVFVVILAIAVLVYVFLKNFDLNKYKTFAENMVYEQTGRKLTIAGDASLGISLIPTIVINDISFANPVWAKNPQMAKIKTIELRFSLLPLLSKQIVVDRALLKEPQIYLETSEDGKNNWDISFASTDKSAAVSESGWLIKSANAAEKDGMADFLSDFVAREVAIENGIVKYYDSKTKSEISLNINQISFNTEGINSPINVSWDVVFNGMELNGKGELGSLSALLSGMGEYPLKLDVKALGIKALLNAKIKNLTSDKLSAVFDYNIYNPAGNMNAPETTLIGTGNATLAQINLDITNLNIVKNLLKGKISANISEKIPYITASIEGDKFDLESLNSSSPTAFNIELIKSAQASAMIPAEVIPYDLLKTVNAKISLKLKQLVVNLDLLLKNVNLQANLNNGTLNVKPLDFNLGQGKASLTAVVSAASRSIAIKGTTDGILMNDIHREFLVENERDFGFLSGGSTQTYIDLKGSGSTLRAVADSLNGQVVAVVDKSELQSGSLKFLTNSFVSQLLNLLKIDTQKNKNVSLKCAVVRADFENGKITFPKGIAIDSDKLNLVSSGTLNLRNDKLSFNINAYRSGVANVSIVHALSNLIKVNGTLQSPKIAIDESGALKTIAGIAATGGALNGAQMLLDKDTAPCYTALENTIYKNKFSKPTGVANTAQKTYQGASQAVNNGIDMVKDSAKEIKNTAKGLIKNILK